ncbi:B-cell linker protein [Chanos chanos]|uniref:B-cell linker protein n=1 Tax=Chanos chanos TaxID=29144 RepID=A0A6J2UQB3_CHACN|nr:B-cell linker protein-like [Chanos chanos]
MIASMEMVLKLTDRNSGPPPPPKRTENSAPAYGGGWPEDEFDEEEDGDTYEPPPCERAIKKVPPRPIEENVYLGLPERNTNPAIPSRHAIPPPRPAKFTPMNKTQRPDPPADPEEFYIDPNARKPPEVVRKDKPGKKPGQRKPPPMRPPLTTQEEACPPVPRNAVPLPGKTMRDPPPPIMKPLVPRASSVSDVLSFSSGLSADPKSAVPPEVKRSGFPGKMPPPTPITKPPLPSGLKEPKPSPPPPPSVGNGGPVSPKSTLQNAGEESQLQDREWFAGNCDRKTAEDILLRVNKDGSFLVRRSSAQNARQPFTLVVLYRQKVYNIPVRFLEDTCSYALGKEGKKSEELFGSLTEMISFYNNNPILLIDSKSQAKHTTYLTHPIRP